MLRSPSWLIMYPRMRPQTPVAMTKDLIVQHGLTEEEYQKIVTLLGREPNLTELGMFSVMWSEHCSYKSSRTFLKKLPTDAPHVIQGPGENAGAVDIGDGLAVVFKIESHNHPSAIEPYQGAATGVVASSGTFLPWGHGPSRFSTPCASVPWTRAEIVTCSRASSPASVATAIASAVRRAVARSTSIAAMPTPRSSTRGSCGG